MRARILAGAALAILSATACTGSADTETPVPEVAEAPFACPGVPERGAELMTGAESVEVMRRAGAWGADVDMFNCVLGYEGDAALIVSEEAIASVTNASPEQVVEHMRTNERTERIESDQPGEGYVWAGGDDVDSVMARWVCDERQLEVELFTRGFEGRDFVEDVSRYLASMLPWACGGQAVPEGG